MEANKVRVLVDLVAWALAIVVGFLLRYEFGLPGDWSESGIKLYAAGVALLLAGGMATGLYRGRWRYGTLDEVATLLLVLGGLTAALLVINVIFDHRLAPGGVVAIAGAAMLILATGVRYLARREVWRGRGTDGKASPAIIFGAGQAGIQLAEALIADPMSGYRPLAFLDDDHSKRRLEVRNIPVVGDRTVLREVAKQVGADTVIIAIPSAEGHTIREVSELALEAGLQVKVLPSISEILDGHVAATEIRPVQSTDLLGRREIDTDVPTIAGYLTGKRVLVTGAGGSIGSELCRQIVAFAPSELVMLDRDESAIHAVQLSIEGRALLDSRSLVIADIRDRDRMFEVFKEHRPQVVFHAAALKHLPLMEMHPGEAIKTNIWGTQYLLDASAEVGVGRFVNISTDKAAEPMSVLGYTKRIAERLTTAAAVTAAGPFVSVRFGNVLGSRGSVLMAFADQLDSGGPLTVTDPEVTRYFMTVQEAVQLLIQAGAIGRAGEALVLDMGEPVKIVDLARQLIAHSGRDDIEVVFTGLRDGEKLHEDLLGRGEIDQRPLHPLISQVAVPPLAYETVEAFDTKASATDQIKRLEAMCVGTEDDPLTIDLSTVPHA